jgi:hypothetical protein
MRLNVACPIATPELTAMLSTVGAEGLLAGTVYVPLMQVLLAPAQQGEDPLVLWELTQKLYANREGTVDLTPIEQETLKAKCSMIAFPWLRARVLSILSNDVSAPQAA